MFYALTGQCSTDTTWPEDTVAIEGSVVVLKCLSSSGRPREWHHLPIDSSSVEISHRYGSCVNGYCERGYSMVNDAPGEYSLRIRNVSSDDAGIHWCVLTNDQRGAELNVIGKVTTSSTTLGFVCIFNLILA